MEEGGEEMKAYRVNVEGLFDNNELLICSTLERKEVIKYLDEIFSGRIMDNDISETHTLLWVRPYVVCCHSDTRIAGVFGRIDYAIKFRELLYSWRNFEDFEEIAIFVRDKLRGDVRVR